MKFTTTVLLCTCLWIALASCATDSSKYPRPPKMNIKNDWSKLNLDTFKTADENNEGQLTKEKFLEVLKGAMVFAGSEEEKEMMAHVADDFVENKISTDVVTLDSIKEMIDTKRIIYYAEDWRIRMVDWLCEKTELFTAKDSPEVRNYFRNNPYAFNINYEMWRSYHDPPIDIDAVFERMKEKQEKKRKDRSAKVEERRRKVKESGLTSEELEALQRSLKEKRKAGSGVKTEDIKKKIEGLIESAFENKEAEKTAATEPVDVARDDL